MRSILCVALFLGGLACTSPNPKSCLGDHHCSDPSLPFCDEDGTIAGTPGTCIAVGCTAGQFQECRGAQALTCNSRGDDYDLVDCPYGCGASGCLPCNTSDCEKHIIPKYLPAICDQLTNLAPVTISDETMLDTSVASMCSSIATQPSGPEICVLRGSTITISSQKRLKVVGTRVLALVADRDLSVDGILDVSADTATNGPGGGFIKSGSSAGEAGGGAGYRAAGGAGGGSAGTGGSANGGPAGASPALVVSLLGGSQAAVAASAMKPGGAGGGVTAISCRGQISITGVIDAGGGGGGGDYYDGPPGPTMYYAPGGGGSGGTVVLQAMAIAVSASGEIYANGGGGGGGGAGNIINNFGVKGSDALRSSSLAPGGPGHDGGANGGAGGTVVAPEAGFRPAGTTCGAGCGAGGASAGFLLTYAPAGHTPAISNTASISPSFEANTVLPTN